MRRGYIKDPITGDIQIEAREGLLARLPPTQGRVKALEELHEKLAIATEFYRGHGDGGRFGVYRAIFDVVEYLASQGIPAATLEVLACVGAAIIDSNDGVSSPIFEPTRSEVGGAPRTAALRLYFEGHLAAIMECCVRHCHGQGMRPFVEPASRMAAQLVNQSKWHQSVTPTEMRELRERVRRKPPGALDRDAFDVTFTSEVAKAMPLRWAETLLNHDWLNPPPKKVSG